MTPHAAKPLVHHCERCGYELTGLGELGACPECNAAFSSTIPFVLQRVPWLTALLTMTVPPAIAGAGALTVGRLAKGWGFESLLIVGFGTLWLLLTFCMPMAVAGRIAESAFTRPYRSWPTAAAFFGGVLLNIATMLLARWAMGYSRR